MAFDLSTAKLEQPPTSSGFDMSTAVDEVAPVVQSEGFPRPDFEGQMDVVRNKIDAANARGDVNALAPLMFEMKSLETEAAGPRGDPLMTAFPEKARETLAARELPELLSSGILAGEDVSKVAAFSAIMGVTPNPEELAKIMSSMFDNISMAQDPGGNFLVANNKLGVTAIVNKPDLSAMDVAQGLSTAAAFFPSAKGITGLGIPALTKLAGRSAATQTGIEGAQVLSGGDFNPDDVALAGIAAPVGQIGGEKIVTPLFKGLGGSMGFLARKGKQGIDVFTKSVDDLSDNAASGLLREQMVREGLTPEKVVQLLRDSGDQAILADTNSSFNRMLKIATNEIPELEGRARTVLNIRQKGQGGRVADALRNPVFNTLDPDDAIAALNTKFKPQIDDLYAKANLKEFTLSEELTEVIAGKNSLGAAFTAAKSRLSDKAAAGDKLSKLDLIQAAKEELDGGIGLAVRNGDKGKVRDLVRLKNRLITEVDQAVPEYAQARDLFAGKVALEDAVENGTQLFKLKPREVDDLTKTMSRSEKDMFLIGAKEAILDKVDNVQVTGDAISRIFGKRGDIKRIQSLFDNLEDFNLFKKAMEAETKFVLTRRAIQGQSSTAKQSIDSSRFGSALGGVRAMAGDPAAQLEVMSSITSGLTGKKGGAVHRAAMEKVGDILLSGNMDQAKILRILRLGTPKQIEAAARNTLATDITRSGIIATNNNRDQ
mgnify:CR=1 FL=1|tara:strand:- start:2094 stop:4235 length:2142 start_codon:yes stop_codon:yes gene_type:complete